VYLALDLQPLTHFYNCHGSPVDAKYYGQKGKDYPTAMESNDLQHKISIGTIVAAECCYGAELYNPEDEGNRNLSIANTYFKNKAIAFVGSSNIAYGPASGQGLADLITQYFIKNILAGASTGRAFLEARQRFLSVSGPDLDPYELKTLGQFYLLGDPSLHPVIKEGTTSGEETVDNRRMNLFNKGIGLALVMAPSQQVKVGTPLRKLKKGASQEMASVFKDSGFTGLEAESLFEIKLKNKKGATFAKGISGSGDVSFRTFVKKAKSPKINLRVFDVLVLKESGNKLLGWKIYSRK
jgi:Peptidase family C25